MGLAERGWDGTFALRILRVAAEPKKKSRRSVRVPRLPRGYSPPDSPIGLDLFWALCRVHIGSISAPYWCEIGTKLDPHRLYMGSVSASCRLYIGSTSASYWICIGSSSAPYRLCIGSTSAEQRLHISCAPQQLHIGSASAPYRLHKLLCAFCRDRRNPPPHPPDIGHAACHCRSIRLPCLPSRR